MSVFKRDGASNYYIQFTYRGKTYLKSARTTKKHVAERMEREWRDQLHLQLELGEKARIRLRDALEGHEQQCIRSGKGDATFAMYNQKLLNAKFPTELYLDEIQHWHLTKLKSDREAEGISSSTIGKNFQGIRHAVNWAKGQGYLVKPLDYPKLRISKHRLRYLSKEEELALLAELDPTKDFPNRPSYENRPAGENQVRQDNYDIVVLLLDTGARYGEIANITWDNINLEQRIIKLWRPKVRNESIIYMTNRVYSILKRRHKAKSAKWLFCNRKGEARGYIHDGINRAFKRAGIKDFRIHDLRHTCASRLVQNGMSLYEVSKILGHTNVQTTQRYAHLETTDISKKARDIMEALAT